MWQGRAAVDQALSRSVKSGKLRRLARGLYDYPKVHPKLGPFSPAPDDVARALARETGSQAQIAGAHAANALGLATQVPAKSLYLTDGPSRRIVLGKRVVDLRHASPKHLIAPGSPAGTVVQALRHVGPVRGRGPGCSPSAVGQRQEVTRVQRGPGSRLDAPHADLDRQHSVGRSKWIRVLVFRQVIVQRFLAKPVLAAASPTRSSRRTFGFAGP